MKRLLAHRSYEGIVGLRFMWEVGERDIFNLSEEGNYINPNHIKEHKELKKLKPCKVTTLHDNLLEQLRWARTKIRTKMLAQQQ